MKVKCKIDRLSQLNDTIVHKRVRKKYNTDDDYGLFITKGKEYIVYGISCWGEDITNFLICEDEDFEYPVGNSSIFFDVVDNSIPNDWKLKIDYDEEKAYTLISFPEMIDDEFFYEKLLDGEEREESIFKEYKKKYKKLYG